MREVFASYCTSRRKNLVLIVVWQFVLYVTIFFNHYGIKIKEEASEFTMVELIWYPILVSFVLLFIYGVYDFIQYERKYTQLKNAMNNIDATLDTIPRNADGIEEKYSELVSILWESKREATVNEKNTYKNMVDFVTIWTHQVKTPLTALQLEVSDLDDPLKSALSSRLFEIEQYADMILQYIRLESDSTDYVFKEHEVKEIVNQPVKYFARVFIRKGISVKVNIPENAKIITDEKWLVFVLKQIISNSLKYTEHGCITIDMPNEHQIQISDTGIGITKEDLPRIFEQGYTGYNGRKDKKATGVGLFLVKNIMDKLGGSVSITSELNKGTIVQINLL